MGQGDAEGGTHRSARTHFWLGEVVPGQREIFPEGW